MTKFNPENKTTLTYGESLSPAMEITDEADARQYFDEYVKFILKSDGAMTEEKAIEVAKINFGYYAGYYSNETRERVERLFLCEHPIFGGVEKYGSPSPEVALAIGKSMGRGMRR